LAQPLRAAHKHWTASEVHSFNVSNTGANVAPPSQAQLNAASDFGTAAIQAFEENGTFPAETVIGAVARMAGSFLFRSFELPLTGIQPGAVVLSEQANQQGPRLVQIIAGVLQGVGVKLDPSKVSASQGKVSGQKEPFLETQKVLGTRFAAIRDRYGLSDVDAAAAAAIATALLIKNCSQRLDPHAGFALAVYGLIEGTKTAPAEADSV